MDFSCGCCGWRMIMAGSGRNDDQVNEVTQDRIRDPYTIARSSITAEEDALRGIIAEEESLLHCCTVHSYMYVVVVKS